MTSRNPEHRPEANELLLSGVHLMNTKNTEKYEKDTHEDELDTVAIFGNKNDFRNSYSLVSVQDKMALSILGTNEDSKVRGHFNPQFSSENPLMPVNRPLNTLESGDSMGSNFEIKNNLELPKLGRKAFSKQMSYEVPRSNSPSMAFSKISQMRKKSLFCPTHDD